MTAGIRRDRHAEGPDEHGQYWVVEYDRPVEKIELLREDQFQVWVKGSGELMTRRPWSRR